MLLVVPLILGGSYLAVDAVRFLAGGGSVSGGGTPHGTLTGFALGYRHLVGFVLKHATEPRNVLTAIKAEARGRQLESQLFWSGEKHNGYDNGPDAYRHAFGSALIAYRLIVERGMAPEEAAAFMREMGVAHEDDSFLRGAHYTGSRTMDLHNNEAGMAVALAQARDGAVRAQPPAEQEWILSEAILTAIRGGAMVVLDAPDDRVRPSTARDITHPIVEPTPRTAFER